MTPMHLPSLPSRLLARPIERLRQGSRTFHITLVVGLAAVAGLGHVHLRLSVLQAGYDISRETHLRRELEDQNQKLRLELETHHDQSLIERRAREELHMAPPDPAAIRVLQLPPVGAPARDRHASLGPTPGAGR